MKIRKGQGPDKLVREEFGRRFLKLFDDPAFEAEKDALERIERIAWDAYENSRKAPVTREAGPGFADPKYELSVEWLETRERLKLAEQRQQNPLTANRVLLISGSARNDKTCPSENSKSYVLCELARETLEREAGCEVDFLDLSLLSSEYGRNIHPCKGCASTAMPLCHWPCTCYPNHSLGQVQDWMAEIYERWTLAHGVIIVTPVYWDQVPSGLKAMMDRLVCADGGNPDPTSTSGKDAAKAKKLELADWPYPRHLAGRAYGTIVHGDVGGTQSLRRVLTDWFEWMGLCSSGNQANLDRFIGYYEPYATSHDALDKDKALQEETRNVARAVAATVKAIREGRYFKGDQGLKQPRQK